MSTYDSTPADPPVAPVRPPLPNPRKIATFGMFLFLASLTMLFAATMLIYLIIRMQWMSPEQGPTPPLGAIRLPMSLWFSTGVILFSSLALHHAGMSIALERQKPFRRSLLITTVLGFVFLIVQVPAMLALLQSQVNLLESNSLLYNLIVFLIILHGLHVVGGLIPLVRITQKAFAGAYDHEHFQPVTHMALYWHFLDVVWLVMFGVLVLLR